MKLLLPLLCSLFLSACGDTGSTSGFTTTPTPETSNPPLIPSTTTTPTDVPSGVACPTESPSLLRNQQGEGTYYVIGNAVNCGLPIPDDLMVVAVNTPQYAGAALCGACLKVTGPAGEVIVKVVDRCPGCAEGDLDLSDAAFAKIADPQQGRVDITWEEVACDTPGPIQYEVKPGSNPWWVGFQLRNHRHRIAKLEALNLSSQYQQIPLLDYNYFVAPQGLGEGPFTLKITDVHGNIIEDGSIPLEEGLIIDSHAQLPECPA